MTNKEIDIDERVTDFFIKEKRSASEIEKILLEEGLDSEVVRNAIDEVSNLIKNLELERARHVIQSGIVFVVLGFVFYVVRANYGRNYGGGADYIGLIVIVYGIYKIIKGYRKRLFLKRDA
jgi:hypothetical protein